MQQTSSQLLEFQHQSLFLAFLKEIWANLAHHHLTKLVKVHGARAIFINFFNDAIQILRGEPEIINNRIILEKELCLYL